MIIKVKQPVRESFAGLSVLLLLLGGWYAFTQQRDLVGYWMLECALVFSILSETYAKD